jgi:hypothetical protein
MKKKVFRAMYGFKNVEEEREIINNLWTKKVDKAVKDISGKKKESTKKKVGK